MRRIPHILAAALALSLAASPSLARGPLLEIEEVQPFAFVLLSDDTLPDLLKREQVAPAEVTAFMNALARRLNLKRVPDEQLVILYRSEEMERDGGLHAIAVPIGNGRTVIAFRDAEGEKRLHSGIYTDESAAELIATAATPAMAAAAADPGGAADAAGEAGPETAAAADAGEASSDTGRVALSLQSGETLLRMLMGAGAKQEESHRAAEALSGIIDLRRLRRDEAVEVTFVRVGDSILLDSVVFPDREEEVEVRRDAFGVFRPISEIAAAPGPEPEEADFEPELEPEPPAVEPSADPGSSIAAPETEQPVDPPVADPEPALAMATAGLVHDTFRSGEILARRLRSEGLSDAAAARAIHAFSEEMDPKLIRAGERFVRSGGPEPLRFFAIGDNGNGAVLVERTQTGGFAARRIEWDVLGEEILRIARQTAPPEMALPGQVAQEPAPEAAPRPLVRSRIERGDTLTERLAGAGQPPREVEGAIAALARVARPDRLQVGQRLVLSVAPDRSRVDGFFLETGEDRGVLVLRDEDGGYTAKKRSIADAEELLAGIAPAAAVAAAPPRREAPGILTASRLLEAEGASRISFTVKENDTLMNILQEAGADPAQSAEAIKALRGEFNPKKIRVGQTVDVSLGEPDGGGPAELEGVSIQISALRSVETVRNGSGYKVHRVERTYQTKFAHLTGTIKTSLYDAAISSGLPQAIYADLLRMYSFDIDFQREIQQNDEFEVLYELRLLDGEVVDHGRIRYAAMLMGGERLPLYFYTALDGNEGYFDDEGRTATKPLMRTPIDGARLSSRFGMRRHPISGYNKMHRGVDFAAPRGTPIYAAGDGTIERIGRYGGYGKYIRIRHNSDYQTAYAHLSRFTKGLRPGAQVRQGDVIGRVGSTGRSTGPHLHYEVLFRNKRVNPLSIDLPVAEPLDPGEMEMFLAERDRLDTIWAEGVEPQRAAELR